MGKKQDIKEAAKSGGELTKKEVKQIAQQYDIPRSEVKSFASKFTPETNTTTNTTNTTAPTVSIKDYLSQGSFGGKINTAEAQTIKEAGYTLGDLQKAGEKLGIKVGGKAEKGFADTATIPGDTTTISGDTTNITNSGGVNDPNAYFSGGVPASWITGTFGVASDAIRAQGDLESNKAIAEAQKYGYDKGLEGTKAEIQGRLDLQPIINAGLQRVAEIEGKSQRDLGRIQLAGSLYNTLGLAFG